MALEPWSDLIAKLPQMRAEYERLGKLIALVEEYAGEAGEPETDTGTAPIRTPSPAGTRQAIRPDEFTGMSASEAVRAYLTRVGRGNPQGPREMARALVAGGRDSDEAKAYANVASALKRMNKMGEVRQVRRGQWGLSSWYGNSGPVRRSAP